MRPIEIGMIALLLLWALNKMELKSYDDIKRVGLKAFIQRNSEFFTTKELAILNKAGIGTCRTNYHRREMIVSVGWVVCRNYVAASHLTKGLDNKWFRCHLVPECLIEKAVAYLKQNIEHIRRHEDTDLLLPQKFYSEFLSDGLIHNPHLLFSKNTLEYLQQLEYKSRPKGILA